jgi:hypothetical protein
VTKKVYALSEHDKAVLARFMEEVRQQFINTPSRPAMDRSWDESDDWIGPEVHVAKPKIDLPPLTPGPPDQPGYGLCDIYRVVRSSADLPELHAVDFDKPVYNVSNTDITSSTWLIVIRDKFGEWYVSGVLGEAGTGSGTGTGQFIEMGIEDFTFNGIYDNIVITAPVMRILVTGPSHLTGVVPPSLNGQTIIKIYNRPDSSYPLGIDHHGTSSVGNQFQTSTKQTTSILPGGESWYGYDPLAQKWTSIQYLAHQGGVVDITGDATVKFEDWGKEHHFTLSANAILTLPTGDDVMPDGWWAFLHNDAANSSVPSTVRLQVSSVDLLVVLANGGGIVMSNGSEYFGFPVEPHHAVEVESGATYTVLAGDAGKTKIFDYAGIVVVTLPQAVAAGGFPHSWYTRLSALAGTVVVINPVTSTIDGFAQYILRPQESLEIVSNGTDYATLRGKQPPGNINIITAATTLTNDHWSNMLVVQPASGTNVDITHPADNVLAPGWFGSLYVDPANGGSIGTVRLKSHGGSAIGWVLAGGGAVWANDQITGTDTFRFMVVPPNADVNEQTGASYTMAVNDSYRMVLLTHNGTVALGLPQPGQTTGFPRSWVCDIQSLAGAAVTITPTSSLIDGEIHKTLLPRQGIRLYSNAENWMTLCGREPLGNTEITGDYNLGAKDHGKIIVYTGTSDIDVSEVSPGLPPGMRVAIMNAGEGIDSLVRYNALGGRIINIPPFQSIEVQSPDDPDSGTSNWSHNGLTLYGTRPDHLDVPIDADYTLDRSDSGRLIVFKCTAVRTLTLFNPTTDDVRFAVWVRNLGDKELTIARNGRNIDTDTNDVIIVRCQAVGLFADGHDWYTFTGKECSKTETYTGDHTTSIGAFGANIAYKS